MKKRGSAPASHRVAQAPSPSRGEWFRYRVDDYQNPGPATLKPAEPGTRSPAHGHAPAQRYRTRQPSLVHPGESKMRLRILAVMASTALVPTVALSQAPAQPPAPAQSGAQTQAPRAAPVTAAEFVSKATNSSLFEIQASQLAQQK